MDTLFNFVDEHPRLWFGLAIVAILVGAYCYWFDGETFSTKKKKKPTKAASEEEEVDALIEDINKSQ